MRILLISPIPPPYGGIARWTENATAYLGRRHEVSVVDTSLGSDRSSAPLSSLLNQLRRTVRIFRALSANLKQGCDVAHINSSCSSIGIIRDYLCAKKIHRRGIPFIFHCHCNVSDQIGKRRLSRLCLSKALQLAGCVYTLNESSEAFCRRFAPDTTKKCPNSIDGQLLAQAHRIEDRLRSVLYVGHLYKSKGIEAILATAKRYPEIQFTLVGPYTAQYSARNDTENLRFVGAKPAEAVIDALDSADLFLFPSHSEGFSVALLEAMARGVPAVVTDVGANREMLEGRGGVVVKEISDDALDLSGVFSAAVRRSMSEWSIQKVSAQYTHEKVFAFIEQDYHRLTGIT